MRYPKNTGVKLQYRPGYMVPAIGYPVPAAGTGTASTITYSYRHRYSLDGRREIRGRLGSRGQGCNYIASSLCNYWEPAELNNYSTVLTYIYIQVPRYNFHPTDGARIDLRSGILWTWAFIRLAVVMTHVLEPTFYRILKIGTLATGDVNVSYSADIVRP